jgi:hypothetical protein
MTQSLFHLCHEMWLYLLRYLRLCDMLRPDNEISILPRFTI